MMNNPSKFQLNILHYFRENEDQLFHPFLLYLEIHAFDQFYVWYAEILGPNEPSYKISAQSDL